MSRQIHTTTRLTDLSRQKMGSRTESHVGSWDDAIADFKQRIRALKQAIQVFQDQKRRGEPWADKSATRF